MVADAVMINAALAMAVILQFMWIVAFVEPEPLEVERPAAVAEAPAAEQPATVDDSTPAGEAEATPARSSRDEDRIISRRHLRAAFWSSVAIFNRSAWPLTAISLIVFFLSGFYGYGYGRAYHGRYKPLIVFQAVTHSYLIFGFADQAAPRGTLILAWLLSSGMLVSSRLWTSIWERVIRPEREQLLRDDPGEPKRVLVIGGAGYIGSALLPKLLDKGYYVRVLDKLVYGDEPIRDLLDNPNLEVIQGDFRRVDKVLQAMQGIDAVVHLGAIVGDPACDLDEKLTIEINLHATWTIAHLARACGIRRFVFASTCSVYGASDDLLSETSEAQPISLYGRTKLAAERRLQGMAGKDFMPTIVRFSTIYGLSGRTRMDLVVNLLSAKAKVDGKITIFGGDQWRPFVHVDDAAAAVARIVESPLSLVGNQIFNVGSDEQNYRIQEIGELIQNEIFTAELICEEGNTDKRNYRVSFAKIQDLLGFKPNWTVVMGIRQIVEAIASGDIKDYRDPRYSNAMALKAGAAEQFRDNNWMDDEILEQKSAEVAA